MHTTPIPIQQGQTLAEALKLAGYPNIPTNVILNKALTGVGATYMEIHAQRNSIIIEPNVPVIEGKVNEHKNCLGVYKGCTVANIKTYLLNQAITYKKLLTTPESFKTILEAVAQLNANENTKVNLYQDYFCLFDECEKIGQDYDYRNEIAYPIQCFYDFENKAFVSATPVELINKELTKLGFTELKVEPQNFDHKVDLELITVNNKDIDLEIQAKLQSLLDSNSKGIFVFYNSIKGIKALIKQFNIKPENYTIFCSDSRVNELKSKELNVQTEVNSYTIRRINFLTSRYFSAVDFKLKLCPDILLITNQSIASHSKIDPSSEAIQIQGRFRTPQPNGKRFSSLCHITDLIQYTYLKTEQINEKLQVWLTSVTQLKQRYQETTNEIIRMALLQEYRQNPLFKYLDSPDFSAEFRLNLFSLINLHYTERVKEAYSSSENLFQAYTDANYFNITHIDKLILDFSFDILNNKKVIIKKDPQKTQIETIINMLERGIDGDEILSLHKNEPDQYVNIQNTIQAIKLLGIESISKLKTFAAIEKILTPALKFKESEERRFHKDIISQIFYQFSNNLFQPISETTIQEQLQQIYNAHDIINKNGKPFIVRKSTIEDYFDQNHNKDKRTYTLKALLPHLQLKINEL